MTLNLDSRVIREILILASDTGLCLYHAQARSSTSVSEDLFASFISAIFTFSQELGSNKLDRMSMGDKSLYMTKKSDYIFVLDVPEGIKTDYCHELLERISQEFIAVINLYNLNTSYMIVLDDVEKIAFESRLSKVIKDVSSRFLAKTPEERFEKIEKLLTSILGKSLGSNVIEEAKSRERLRNIEDETSLARILAAIETSLKKRVGRQTDELMRKIKEIS